MVTNTGDKPAVEFYFDASCPWSYLALERVREAAIRTGARVIYRPVLVDDVLHAANPAFPADRTDPVAVRARYQAKDLADWARYCGLTLRRPKPWPIRPEWAQRGAVAAAELGGPGGAGIAAYLAAVFAALFADNRDISDLAVVEALAATAGLDGVRFAALVRDEATRLQVEANGAELVARGGFGTPTFLVASGQEGGDLYFGNDRLPLVEAALARLGGMRLVLPGAHGA
ncbi:MAG: 2-hydroxychromene-2-carboxylate isomerase [Chromatiales bacterium]|nr:2-hydroxychromene-2-carboxylate isomerase [Chromatiales bacterium]